MTFKDILNVLSAIYALMAELVDARDLKSRGRKSMRVRLPLGVLKDVCSKLLLFEKYVNGKQIV